MKKVLFLCTGNSARSIIAECLLNQIGESRFSAHSAGSKPAGQVNPFTIKVLKNNNIKYRKISSKNWDIFKNMNFNFVVTVCNNAANETCPVYPGSPTKIHWDIEDPAAYQGNDVDKLDEFQRVFKKIEKMIKMEFINK